MQIAVCCVKWGSKYGAHYVNRLRNMVARHLSVPHDFICFTDDPAGLGTGILTKPLDEGWVGWWNKIALFRPDAFDPSQLVFYFDLDVVIVSSIDFLLDSRADLTISHNSNGRYRVNSSVMVFRPEQCGDIFSRFAADPEGIARSFKGD